MEDVNLKITLIISFLILINRLIKAFLTIISRKYWN